MLNYILAFFIGIVEAISEWLPISSTGHIILFNSFFPLQVSESFWDIFLVVIQLGAVLAVVVLYFDKLFPFSFKKGEKFLVKDIWYLWLKIFISCIPAMVIGLPFDEVFEKYFYNAPSIAVALIVFGILFIVIEKINKSRETSVNSVSEISLYTAFLIGVFQVLAAIFPGVSRSGATILGAILIGVSRTVAAEYTFYLAVPAMFGASILKIGKTVLEGGFSFTAEEYIILAIGTVTAFVFSLFAIKFLIGYVKKHDFKPFGYYRIVLGAVVIISALCGVIK